MRRRRKKRIQGEVELNLAAMLDMAFQLLAFFVLTFKPQPLEGYISLRMPPPNPTTKPQATAAATPTTNQEMPALETLNVTVTSTETGEIGAIRIEESEALPSLQAFEERINGLLGAPGATVEQLVLHIGTRLNYENLVRVLDVCSRIKFDSGETLKSLSIVALPEG